VGLNDLAVTLFPLPTSGEKLKLLPTPTAHDSTGVRPLTIRKNRARLNDVAVELFPLPHPKSEAKLLPTPRASDGTKGSARQRGSKGDLTLPSAVIQLTTPPTPKPIPPGGHTKRPSAAGRP
jgi:DNA (cytosine-5)-methyltransferase 1